MGAHACEHAARLWAALQPAEPEALLWDRLSAVSVPLWQELGAEALRWVSSQLGDGGPGCPPGGRLCSDRLAQQEGDGGQQEAVPRHRGGRDRRMSAGPQGPLHTGVGGCWESSGSVLTPGRRLWGRGGCCDPGAIVSSS